MPPNNPLPTTGTGTDSNNNGFKGAHLRLKLNENSVQAGQTISGVVVLEVRCAFVYAQALTLTLTGQEQTWIDSGGSSSSADAAVGGPTIMARSVHTIYEPDEIPYVVIKHKHVHHELFMEEDKNNHNHGKIGRGKYTLEFSHRLPSHLPGKLKQQKRNTKSACQVSYQLQAILKSTDGCPSTSSSCCHDLIQTTELVVHPAPPKSSNPRAFDSHQQQQQQQATTTTQPKKKTKRPSPYRVQVDSTYVRPGQVVNIQVQLPSSSLSSCGGVAAKLVERSRWKTLHPRLSHIQKQTLTKVLQQQHQQQQQEADGSELSSAAPPPPGQRQRRSSWNLFHASSNNNGNNSMSSNSLLPSAASMTTTTTTTTPSSSSSRPQQQQQTRRSSWNRVPQQQTEAQQQQQRQRRSSWNPHNHNNYTQQDTTKATTLKDDSSSLQQQQQQDTTKANTEHKRTVSLNSSSSSSDEEEEEEDNTTAASEQQPRPNHPDENEENEDDTDEDEKRDEQDAAAAIAHFSTKQQPQQDHSSRNNNNNNNSTTRLLPEQEEVATTTTTTTTRMVELSLTIPPQCTNGTYHGTILCLTHDLVVKVRRNNNNNKKSPWKRIQTLFAGGDVFSLEIPMVLVVPSSSSSSSSSLARQQRGSVSSIKGDRLRTASLPCFPLSPPQRDGLSRINPYRSPQQRSSVTPTTPTTLSPSKKSPKPRLYHSDGFIPTTSPWSSATTLPNIPPLDMSDDDDDNDHKKEPARNKLNRLLGNEKGSVQSIQKKEPAQRPTLEQERIGLVKPAPQPPLQGPAPPPAGGKPNHAAAAAAAAHQEMLPQQGISRKGAFYDSSNTASTMPLNDDTCGNSHTNNSSSNNNNNNHNESSSSTAEGQRPRRPSLIVMRWDT